MTQTEFIRNGACKCSTLLARICLFTSCIGIGIGCDPGGKKDKSSIAADKTINSGAEGPPRKSDLHRRVPGPTTSFTPGLDPVGMCPNFQAFSEICRGKGIILKRLDSGEWAALGLSPQDYFVTFSFKCYPRDTSEQTIRDSLFGIQLPFPYINESAEMAMSCRSVVGNPDVPRNAYRDSITTEERLADLFKNFSTRQKD